jgi:CHASE2 domain-containing sensor protein
MKKFWIDCVFATMFVFVTLYGLKQLTTLKVFNAFDVIGQAIGDMELADIAFSQLREDPPIDTNVVIVNIGYLSRGQIGQQINNLNKCGAKVIGLDMFFSCDFFNDSINCPQAYDTLDNMMFAGAVLNYPNMVMVERLTQTDSLVSNFGDVAIYDSIEHTYPTLLQTAHEGFANLETDAEQQEDLKSCRRFVPRVIMADGTEELAFSVKMALGYDSAKTKKFLARNKNSEVINYRGNIVDWHGASQYAGRYAVLDWDQALDTTSFLPSMIRGKVVILGFLGSDLRDTSWDDKFFTPLNKKYAGKSLPDMYGVVVHANIVSMILSEDYIDELAPWQEYAIAILLVFLNVVLFAIITRRNAIWFDSLSLLIQVIQVVILSYLMVQVLSWSNFKLNLTLSLAAVALVGTCFELYGSVVKRVFEFFAGKVAQLSAKRAITNQESGV